MKIEIGILFLVLICKSLCENYTAMPYLLHLRFNPGYFYSIKL